jgi:hypothetical protein
MLNNYIPLSRNDHPAPLVSSWHGDVVIRVNMVFASDQLLPLPFSVGNIQPALHGLLFASRYADIVSH